MGSGSFSTADYSTRATYRAASGIDGMKFSADIAAGKVAAKVHESLDVRNKPVRECRDNSDNPEARAIAILTDVTGSMGGIADLILANLHKTVTAIRDKGVVKYPSLLTGAIGDAYCDRGPLQIGEFESDDELVEKHLSNVWKEKGGGGQDMESYDLGMWFFANCVETDSWEKRGEKGFLFIIGDEAPYPKTIASQVKNYVGLDTEDINLEDLVQKLLQKWEVFVIRPGGTNCFRSPSIQAKWEAVLPSERVVKIEDWEEVTGFIASTISVIAGLDVVAAVDAAKNSGLKVGDATTSALSKLSTSAIASADVGTDSKPIKRLS